MTREDANFILANIDRRVCDAELSEALDMAIKALSAEPCEDTISRHAVLDGIEELKKSPWATDKRGDGFEYLIKEALEVVADLCVRQEPSVTPKQTDALDKIRAEIKEQYGGCGLINDGLDMALSIIDKYMAESEDTE